jgi:DNA-binding NarL/FixJ family response regulator
MIVTQTAEAGITHYPTVGVSLPAVFLFNDMEKSVLSAFISMNGDLAMTTLSDLTPREIEILQLVLAGYTNRAIAAEIFISEKTVEFHLDNIYTKIGVRTRLMAGVWALQHGMAETREIPS